MKNITLSFSILLVSLALAAAVHAKDYSNNGEEYRNPWLEAYAGLGYYNWKIGFSSPSYGGKSFTNTMQPFILKKFDLRSNLRIVQFGLNYFTSRFDNALNTTDESDVARENDQLARQLAMFAGIGYGWIVVTADAKFKKFQGNIRSNGVTMYDGTQAPVRVYTSSGPVDLLSGMEATWYSLVKDYTFKVGTPWKRKPGANAAFEFGGRMVKYSSPVEIEVKKIGGFPEKNTLGLFESDITQYFVGMSFWVNYTWTSGFYWEWSFPAFLGANKIENAYLVMQPAPYTFSTVGKMATGYRSGYVRIEMGLDYDYYISTAMSSNNNLKKDIEYYQTSTIKQKFDAGTKVDLKMTRMELFWGVYLHATLLL